MHKIFAVGTALLLAVLLVTLYRPDVDPFEEWMSHHGRLYTPTEATYRRSVFLANLEHVRQHNALAALGRYSYTLEVNKFADLADSEYLGLYSLPMRKPSVTEKCKLQIDITPNPPDSVDWTERSVTDVQDQGLCGASWAFAATGALEGLYAISAQANGKLAKLSDQQLLDCSDSYGNEGCNGGLMDQAFWYVIDNGIALGNVYAYTGKDQICAYKSTMKFMQIKDCAEVPSGSFMKLVSAVIQQPVSVAVDASQFKFYKEGVFDGECSEEIDTGMLLIGYGTTDDNKSYWRLKNSIGTDWGINGTMLLSMGDKADGPGKCGIQLLATVPRNLG